MEDGYSCACESGFTGPECETGKINFSLCGHIYCINKISYWVKWLLLCYCEICFCCAFIPVCIRLVIYETIWPRRQQLVSSEPKWSNCLSKQIDHFASKLTSYDHECADKLLVRHFQCCACGFIRWIAWQVAISPEQRVKNSNKN